MLIQPGRVYAYTYLDAFHKIRQKHGNGLTSLREVSSANPKLRWFEYCIRVKEVVADDQNNPT